MRTLRSLFAIFIPVLFFGQSIQIHSIKDSRQPTGDIGHTLDGMLMTGARAKLQNSANFGPNGTYKKTVLIADSFETSGSLVGVASLPVNDIFFFGNFDVANVGEIFLPEEVDALYDWSLRGGRMIICAGQNGSTDTQILNYKWGFNFAVKNNALCVPTAQGSATGLFNNRFHFGSVSSVTQGNPDTGYFDSIPENVKILATAPGEPTLIMDCNTLDLIVADGDVFSNRGGMTTNGNIQNNQDRFWVNTIAFMDSLQPLPVLVNTKDTLNVPDIYSHYQWYKDDVPIAGANSYTAVVDGFGKYSLETEVDGGCLVRSNDFIKPDTTIILDNECDLFVPTAFSPDGNGINETLCAYGKCFQDIHFKVFDRWGELVFESKDRWFCWDGNYKGGKANSGTYVWSYKATRPSGTTVNRKGSTQLIR